MNNDMSIYRAHMAAREISDQALLAHFFRHHANMGGVVELHMSAVRRLLDELAVHLGCTVVWPSDSADEDAAVAEYRKLEAEDAARDDTFAELQEMTAAPKETVYA